MPRTVKFGELTYREIRQHHDDGCLALVPAGCTEQQGPHLPVSFDTCLVETIACAAAKEAARTYGVCVVVLPTLPFGPTPEHRGFRSGYIDIPRDLHEAVVGHVLASLADQGFRRMVIWRGCGGHGLRQTVDRFNRQYSGRARAFVPDLPYHAIWCGIGDPRSRGRIRHLAALYLRPEMVRRDLISNPSHTPVDRNNRDLDLARHSTSGVIGNPTTANAELGAELWEAVVSDVARTLHDLAQA